MTNGRIVSIVLIIREEGKREEERERERERERGRGREREKQVLKILFLVVFPCFYVFMLQYKTCYNYSKDLTRLL